jgi:transposase
MWPFYAAHRVDGKSGPAYEPALMVALLTYAYARGIRFRSHRARVRGGRRLERRRRAAAAGSRDATIARFIERHEAAMAGLFGEVLLLCARSGLAKVGVIAIDGTRVPRQRQPRRERRLRAPGARDHRRGQARRREEIYGERRGDELPEELATGEGRRAWLREAKRRLERQRDERPRPVARSRPKRVTEATRRLEEELGTEVGANEAYEHYRARDRMRNGRRLGAHSPPKPYTPPATPQGRINTTDPDSHVVKRLIGSRDS